MKSSSNHRKKKQIIMREEGEKKRKSANGVATESASAETEKTAASKRRSGREIEASKIIEIEAASTNNGEAEIEIASSKINHRKQHIAAYQSKIKHQAKSAESMAEEQNGENQKKKKSIEKSAKNKLAWRKHGEAASAAAEKQRNKHIISENDQMAKQHQLKGKRSGKREKLSIASTPMRRGINKHQRQR